MKPLINKNQKIALLSFIYNVGVGAFERSTLLKKINYRDFDGAAREFEKWVFSKGKKLNGLVKRRKAEMEMFLKPIGGSNGTDMS